MYARHQAAGTATRDNTHERERLARLARFLDSAIELPGGYRIGYEALIGLIPGIGDAIGTVLSSIIVVGAARAGVSGSTLALMVYNVAVESLIGSVPVVGDLFDFVWKANEKNMALYDSYFADPKRAKRSNRVKAAVPIAGLLLLLVVVGMIAVSVIQLLIRAIS